MLPYCGNHFTIRVWEVTVLYTLSLYSNACHLYLNKTEKIKYLKTHSLSVVSQPAVPARQ